MHLLQVSEMQVLLTNILLSLVFLELFGSLLYFLVLCYGHQVLLQMLV